MVKWIRAGDRVVTKFTVEHEHGGSAENDYVLIGGHKVRVTHMGELVDVEQEIRKGDRVRTKDGGQMIFEVVAIYEDGNNWQAWLRTPSEWPLRTVVRSAIVERIQS